MHKATIIFDFCKKYNDFTCKKQPIHKTRTIASLDPVKSFVSGAFSLDKIPSLAIGPEVLLRVGSDEDHPIFLPSFPPPTKRHHIKKCTGNKWKSFKDESDDKIREGCHRITNKLLNDMKLHYNNLSLNISIKEKLKQQGYLTVHQHLQKLAADQNSVQQQDPVIVILSLPLKIK